MLEGRLDGLLEATLALLRHADAVHHKFYVVCLVAVHLHVVGQLAKLPVHADAQVSLLRNLLEEFTVVTFAAAHQRCQYQYVFASKLVGDELYDFAFGVAHHFLAADVRVGIGNAGVEQSDKVVNLCHSAYCGAGVLVGGFLLDTDDGTEAVDAVDVGTLHVADKMTSVG